MYILIVSPPFPPFSGVGALRMRSLAMYLHDHGENITVIRNEPGIWGDDNKLEVPKEIDIVDVSIKSDRLFEENALLYEKAIENVLSKRDIDLIIYSVGPYYTLKSAIRINEKHHVKYILDFRDLWIYEKKGGIDCITKLKRFIKLYPLRNVEKKAVQEASFVTVVDPGDRDIMQRKYKLPKDKVHVIYNGHEVENTRVEPNGFEEFTIINLGKFGYYSFQLAQTLLLGINELANRGIPVRVLHVGKEEPEIEGIMARHNLDRGVYKCTGYLSYEEGIEIAKKAHVALIIYRHRFGFGTKIFDYIACNKPIILLCKGKESLADFVREFENGFVCTNQNELIKAVDHLYKNNITHLDAGGKLIGYSRNEQNEKFYKHIIRKTGSQE